MVSNEGKITTFGTTGTLGGLVDGTDKLHSGILKTLWNVSNGSRVVSSGTLTQSSGTFTLATPVIYRSNGTKVILGTTASHGQATVGAGMQHMIDMIYFSLIKVLIAERVNYQLLLELLQLNPQLLILLLKTFQ